MLEGKAGSLEMADGIFAVTDLVAPAILALDFLKAKHAFVDICGADIGINVQRIGCFPPKQMVWGSLR